MQEIYISVDIESDGPIPGINSMLSLGAAAFVRGSRVPVATFSVNLRTLVGAVQDPETMAWWAQNKDAYDATRVDAVDADQAVMNFVKWVKGLGALPVFVGYPAGYDFLFVYWYMIRFVGESPFSFSSLDIKTYAMATMKKNYRESVKRNMPRRWFEGTGKHTHVAVEDAVEQGVLFMNMLHDNETRK